MIKEITKEMLQELSQLFINAFNAEPWNDQWTEETVNKRLLDFINTPGFYGLAKYEDGQAVAMILGRSEQYYDGEIFQILEFCVDREKQGQGIGKQLLNEMLTKLGEMEVKDVFLLTLHGELTEGFYAHNGFELEEPMIMMKKSISGSKRKL